MYNNDNMEDGSGWTPKNGKTEIKMERCYMNIHEGERSNDRRRTRPEYVEIET